MFPYMLVAKALAVVALLAALAYGWYRFTEHYVEQGREEVRAELQPKLDAAEKRATNAEAANVKLAASLKTLETTLAEQRTAMDGIKQAQERAQAATKAALARIAANAKAASLEIDRLRALARTRLAVPMTDAEDVAAADRLLREVLAARMAEEVGP